MKTKDTKIFFISLPFDEKNSGDYDYCQASVNALKKISQRGISAEYITSDSIEGYDANTARDLVNALGQTRNKGGEKFYSSLAQFYNSEERKKFINLVKKYLVENKDQEANNILNVQIRPPETGFLFSPSDLEELKSADFKVCVTCHEYKLNYDRRWLQSILHPYFEVADSVFFFNEKDLRNASKHATRSVFLEDIFQQSTEELSTTEIKSMKHGFSSKSSSSLVSQSTTQLFVAKQELAELNCHMFIGELKYLKGAPIRYSAAGQKTKASPPLLLEWGVRTDLDIPKLENKFSVSGVIIRPHQTTEIGSIKSEESEKSSFAFNHRQYELSKKSKLSKVPPTTADIDQYNSNIDKFIKKPANIITFGLIREGKGYEDAIEVIKEAKASLPNTRLLITGKPDSLKLLAQIIGNKFDCLNILKEEDLQEASKSESLFDGMISKIRNEKLANIKKVLLNNHTYSDGIEELVWAENLKKISQQKSIKSKIAISNPSLLQKFIWKIEEEIPESLPIDIFLDIPKHELPQIFEQAKYALKYDEKGWANNASGLINLLSYGCILYTSWGMCTGKDVIEGKYKEAIVLPKGKYCLRTGEHLTPEEEKEEKRNHFKSKSDAKKVPIDEKKNLVITKAIIDDIIARERSDTQSATNDDYSSEYLISSANNRLSFEKAGLLLSEQFSDILIAQEMLKNFRMLLIDGHDLEQGLPHATNIEPIFSESTNFSNNNMEIRQLEEEKIAQLQVSSNLMRTRVSTHAQAEIQLRNTSLSLAILTTDDLQNKAKSIALKVGVALRNIATQTRTWQEDLESTNRFQEVVKARLLLEDRKDLLAALGTSNILEELFVLELSNNLYQNNCTKKYYEVFNRTKKVKLNTEIIANESIFNRLINDTCLKIIALREQALEGSSACLYNYTDIGDINKYWGKYTLDGIAKILKLRINDLNLWKDILVLDCVFLDEENSNIHELIKKIVAVDEDKTILVPLNLFNKHAVGLVFEKLKGEGKSYDQKLNVIYKITYIDPSNEAIPQELRHLLYSALKETNSKIEIIIKELSVEPQKYANCGPEVVENFVYYLTGCRMSQEEAIELHSELVERELMRAQYAAQEKELVEEEEFNITSGLFDNTKYFGEGAEDSALIGDMGLGSLFDVE